MKNGSKWNRRDFMVKPAVAFAASQLLGGSTNLLSETKGSGDAVSKAEPAVSQSIERWERLEYGCRLSAWA
jgi:hypothetical protein